MLVREASNALHAIIARSADDPDRVEVSTPPLDLAPFSWHHVALTRADDRIAIYVDGVLRAQAPATPIVLDSRSYTIGVGSLVGSYQGWVGAIDEIALYDRPLDSATIEAHARAGDDGAVPVARADPAVAALQSQAGVIHLTTGKAGASFRCALDGSAYSPCRQDYTLERVADGTHVLRVLATSRTGVTQVEPSVLRFAVDGTVPGTVMAMRLAPRDDGRAIVSFGSDSTTSFECRARNPGLSSSQPVFAPCRAPMDVAAGTTFEVRAFDAAGNRDPSTRFALSHPAAVTIDVLRRGRTPAIRVAAAGRTGANIVKISARTLHRLRQGRYTVRVAARGATGRTAVQQLPLAIVPPLR